MRHICLFFILIVMIAFSNCKSGKHVVDFKSQKKQIDTLSVNIAFVNIDYTNGEKRQIDSSLTKKVKDKVIENTNNTLKGKYVIKLVKKELNKDSLKSKSIKDFNDRVEMYSKIIEPIDVPEAYRDLFQPQDRYCLMLLCYGFYDNRYETNYFAKKSLNNNINGECIIIINAPKLNKTEMVLLLFDNKKNKVLYIDIVNSKTDPRIENDIDLLISGILRKIYYK